MRFEEFRELDTKGAYSEYYSIAELKANGKIPEDFHECVDNDCECGSERMATADLTIVNCCDPRCVIKMGYTLENIIRYFGGTGLGPSKCSDLINHGITRGIVENNSPIEVLRRFSDYEWVLGASYKNLEDVMLNMFSRRYTFSDIVQAVNIPGLDTKSHDIFGKIYNSKQLLGMLEKMDIYEFFFRRGIEDLKVAFAFKNFFFDVLLLEAMLKDLIINPAFQTISICCTGAIRYIPEGFSRPPTRAQFINYLKEIATYKGVNIMDFKNVEGAATVPYVVSDSPRGGGVSAKLAKALEREISENSYAELMKKEFPNREYEPRKILYTTEEFVNFIKSEVEKCKIIIDQSLEETN